jgi:ABC-type multidrug transport system permease subunit
VRLSICLAMFPFSIHRLWAILQKEFRHIWRDKRTLFLVTLSPAIMLFTFAYLFAFEVQNVRLGVWDMDRTATSRQFIASITADGKFKRTETLMSYEDVRNALMHGTIHLAIVIPLDFEAKLYAGDLAPIQVIADGSDSVTASQTVARFRQRALDFNRQISIAGANSTAPISVQTQAWYNRELNSQYSMVPGLLPIVLILPSLALALAVSRERELGSFETLATTPIRGIEYLLGKLIPYIVFGLVSAGIAILLAIVWFHVPLRGTPMNLALFTVIYLFASLGETLFIASFLTSQGTAMRVVLLIFFIPSFFMAGVILPVDTRSGIAQLVSSFLPATQYVQMTRGIFLKALGIPDLLTQGLYLAALGAVPTLISLWMFKKQVD